MTNQSIIAGGEWGVIDTSGPLWTEHRRFALKTLRDFGMGKNLMEEKVTYFPVLAQQFPALPDPDRDCGSNR